MDSQYIFEMGYAKGYDKGRADERRKFAEWIMFFIDGYYFKSADEILTEYEKQLNDLSEMKAEVQNGTH